MTSRTRAEASQPSRGDVTPRLLREAGYQAIRRMKAERDTERRRRRHLESEVETLRSVIELLKQTISKGNTHD